MARVKWLDEEIEVLRANAGTLDNATIQTLIPSRTVEGIRQMRGKLGLDKVCCRFGRLVREWTKAEDAKLKEMASTHTAREIAEKLNRSFRAVEVRARRSGISIRGRTAKASMPKIPVGGKGHRWTKKEIFDLRFMAGRYGSKQIAEKLNRSQHAIKVRASRLKIPLREGWTLRDVARLIGTDSATIAAYRKSLGQTWRLDGNVEGAHPEEIAEIARAIIQNPATKCEAPTRRLKLVADGKLDDAWLHATLE